MKSFCVGLVLLLVCFPDSELKMRSLLEYEPELDWNAMRDDLVRVPKSADTNHTLPQSKRVPPFLVVSSSNDPVEAFKPEMGARDLPEAVKEMLLQALGATPPTLAPPPGGGGKAVEVRCHIGRIYVRVKKAIFKVKTAIQNLKLGVCTVNKILDEHYYFLYPLTANCGFQTLSAVDDFTVKISLRYGPVGPVVRDVPFNINIRCKYPRFFHSFKVGIHPKVEGGTLHKLLKQCVYTLRAKDENGNELTGNETIPLGHMLYFEASRAVGTGSSVNERIYIVKCFLTTSKDPSSEPKYYVIDKGGCMMDSMASERSKFFPSDSKSVLKFGMPAIVLNDSLSLSSPVEQKLFMHCETAVGPEKATEVHKACNYDMQEGKWKELYDDDHSVCSCCGSTCDTKQLKFRIKEPAVCCSRYSCTISTASNRNIVSSRAWKVNWGNNNDPDIDFSLEDQVYVVMDP